MFKRLANALTVMNANSTLLKRHPTTNTRTLFLRTFSTEAPLTKQIIESRVISVLKNFDKIKVDPIPLTATFNKDLGLDSLDVVEVVMAIEEEFNFEIPDKEADLMKSPLDAVEFIAKNLIH